MNIENNEETWVKPNEYLLYKQVTGLSDNVSTRENRKVNHLAEIFIDVYKNYFLKSDFYPLNLKERVIKRIKNNESLKEESLLFKEKYTNDNHKELLDYIGKIILPIEGTDFFCEYLRNMIEKYSLTIEEKNVQTFNNMVLTKYIFGFNYPLTAYFKIKTEGYASKNDCIYFLILKEIFPYTVVNYARRDRNKVYEILEYSEQQIAECEEKVKCFNKESYRKGYARIILDENNVKYKGYKITDFYKYIDEYFDHVLKTERTITFFTDFIKETVEFVKEKDEGLIFKNASKNKECRLALHAYYDKKNIEAKEYWYKNNQNELKKNKSNFIIYYKYENNYKKIEFDMNNFPLDVRKKVLKYICYLEKKYSANKGLYFQQNISTLCDFFNFIINIYDIADLEDIERKHILSYLSYLDTVKNIKPSTIAFRISRLRKFFNYMKNNIDDSIKDPTININISNVRDHSKTTRVIPDDILIFLDNNISKMKQEDLSLIYRLLSETGWRFGDIVKTEIDNIFREKEDSEFATIKISTSKTKKARIKNRLGNILESNISIKLYEDICNYVTETNTLRKTYNINSIFFTVKNGIPSAVEPATFNKAINGFLLLNNIKSVDESYYDFTCRQTRKTVASNLISAGASIPSVQKQLGHVLERTTVQSYIEVHRSKISEANHEFFKEKFGIYLDEEKLKLFTEEERQLLYEDFISGHRNTELGVCSKHPSEGRCVHLGQKSCAACPKLCTGKAYLEQWEKLMNDSYNLLIQFENKYKGLNIPEEEYQNYIEYKQEKRLHEQYKSVVESIKGGK